jgi:hypothetical protein
MFPEISAAPKTSTQMAPDMVAVTLRKRRSGFLKRLSGFRAEKIKRRR